MVVRGFLVWLGIVPLAVGNGALRDLLLVAWMGPVPARFFSGVSLCALVLGWTALTARWIGATRPREVWLLGGHWAVLAVAFEFGFGRLVAHKSWEALLRAYTFQGGDIWPVVLLCIAVSPALVWYWRRSLPR